jgi:hypothetical protein
MKYYIHSLIEKMLLYSLSVAMNTSCMKLNYLLVCEITLGWYKISVCSVVKMERAECSYNN